MISAIKISINRRCFECLFFGNMDCLNKSEIMKCNFVFWVCSVLYNDVLSVSIRFSVKFCIYEHI